MGETAGSGGVVAAPEDDSLGRRLWAAGLTGIPFGVFKLGAGWHLQQVLGEGWGGAIGVAFVVWGALDVLLNVLAAFLPDRVGYCLLSNLGRAVDLATGRGGHQQAMLALDTLLSFAIVAYMIWFRRLPDLPPLLGRSWDLAVVCNVLGVGLERVWLVLRRREAREAASRPTG